MDPVSALLAHLCHLASGVQKANPQAGDTRLLSSWRRVLSHLVARHSERLRQEAAGPGVWVLHELLRAELDEQRRGEGLRRFKALCWCDGLKSGGLSASVFPELAAAIRTACSAVRAAAGATNAAAAAATSAHDAAVAAWGSAHAKLADTEMVPSRLPTDDGSYSDDGSTVRSAATAYTWHGG